MTHKLRPWHMADIDSLVRYANNANIAKFMTNQFPHPYTREKGTAFIEYAMQAIPTHVFAIEVNGEAAGGIGIHPMADIYSLNAELGYWLGEPFWGKGIVTAAVREMVEYGFKTFEIARIFARPFGDNPASQRVLEKAGFELEARLKNTFFKNGRFADELIYAVRRKPNQL